MVSFYVSHWCLYVVIFVWIISLKLSIFENLSFAEMAKNGRSLSINNIHLFLVFIFTTLLIGIFLGFFPSFMYDQFRRNSTSFCQFWNSVWCFGFNTWFYIFIRKVWQICDSQGHRWLRLSSLIIVYFLFRWSLPA